MSPDFKVMKVTRRVLFLTGAAALLPRSNPAAGPSPSLITLSPSPKESPKCPSKSLIDEIHARRAFLRPECHHHGSRKSNSPEWTLEIAGLVDRPLAFTLCRSEETPARGTRQQRCSNARGNGRSFYQPYVAGAQWRFGSVGNARWTGVRLKGVLEKSGVKPAATQLLLDGADVPLVKMPKFQRTISEVAATWPPRYATRLGDDR